jgi:glucan phosphoethanolaminetransferase (alkaline phosphatase superfamily)
MMKFYSNLILFFSNNSKKDIIFCGLASLIFLFFFNDFDYKNISKPNIFLSFLLIFLVCYALFLIFSVSHKILKLFIVILLFFSTINIYIKNKYGYILDEIMIANALDSVGHIDDVVDYHLLLYFLFLTIIPAIILTQIKLQKADFVKKFLLLFVILITAVILVLVSPKYVFTFATNAISPSNYISASYRYYERFKTAKETAVNRQSLTNFYKFEYNDKIKDKKDELKIVVVMGESLRADHLQIFGYNRQTTPNLMNIKNLLKFRSQAFFTITTPAITDLLSHRLNSEFKDIPSEKSLIDLMKNLDFKTHWYSAQSSKQFGTEMLSIMAMEADNYLFRDRIRIDFPSRENTYDEDLLPYFSKAIQDEKKNFIFLHSFGSHTHYFERFPEKFKIYSDQCGKNLKICSTEQIYNAYDNTVLYTDYFLNEVIKIVDKHNAILFYISDHGSFLGENFIYANGSNNDASAQAHNVPIFIYFSEKLQKNKNYKSKFLKAKSNQDKALNPDYFFDSILDCSLIESSLIKNRKFSVCSDIN